MAVPESRTTEIDMLPPATAAVGVASALAVAARASRRYLSLVNDGDEDVYIAFKAANAAVVGSGTLLVANGGTILLPSTDARVRHQVNAIVGAATSVLTVQEGE